jgi:hypothetical protein
MPPAIWPQQIWPEGQAIISDGRQHTPGTSGIAPPGQPPPVSAAPPLLLLLLLLLPPLLLLLLPPSVEASVVGAGVVSSPHAAATTALHAPIKKIILFIELRASLTFERRSLPALRASVHLFPWSLVGLMLVRVRAG